MSLEERFYTKVDIRRKIILVKIDLREGLLEEFKTKGGIVNLSKFFTIRKLHLGVLGVMRHATFARNSPSQGENGFGKKK